jgi:integrase
MRVRPGLNDPFEEAIDDALSSLPADLRAAMSNVEIVVEDEPPDGQPLLGLYRGVPLPRRSSTYLSLRWTDVDLDMRRLRVSRAYSEEAPRGEMSPVKDHQARTVPIPRTVVDELTDLQAQSAPSELVFPSANSTPLRNRNFRRDSFDTATATLGLTITPHNLRDTASSLAIQAGASVVAVARLLGHESAATTLNHYAWLFPTDLDDVAVRVDAAAREAVGDQ